MNYAVGVCGFGRCGSTMLMAMLDAGGIPPSDGTSPGSYEGDLVPQIGRTIKLLDKVLRPEFPEPPPGFFRFVWLDRDYVQQARSQVKFAEAMFPGLSLRVADFAASYGKDRPVALGRLRRMGPVLVLQYERILVNPRKAAKALQGFLGDLDIDRAARVVHRRNGVCRPDLSVELGLAGV